MGGRAASGDTVRGIAPTAVAARRRRRLPPDNAIAPPALPDARPSPLDTELLVRDAYVLHDAALVRHLARLLHDVPTAEDLAQEAFLRLALEVAAHGAPQNVPAWLFRVGTNLVVSRARRTAVATRVGRRLVPSAPDRSLEMSPEGMALDTERTEALSRALLMLPHDHRTALVLAARGYRGGEIAAILGRSPLATRALLHRARVRLRVQLEDGGLEA
jgi:RNA polymerase sigma factor (sigma-70 family)